MVLDSRHYHIDFLLATALDDDEEYLYEGEMSTYSRSYAVEAAMELRTLMERTPLSGSEMDSCISALADPRRIEEGRSERVLGWLGEAGRLMFIGLAAAEDPQLRLFAIRAAGRLKPGASYYNCLCRIIVHAPQLLDDPVEEVRLAAASGSDWMRCNIEFIKRNFKTDRSQPVIRIFYKFIELLDDPSPEVRAAAVRALGSWAPEVARGALTKRLESEADPEVREALTKALNGATLA